MTLIPYNSTTAICIMAVAFTVMLALHILSTFLPECVRRTALPINVAVHALLVIPALLFTDPDGVPIELDVIALVYMTSLAVYTVCYFISDAIAKRREASASSEAEKEADDDL